MSPFIAAAHKTKQNKKGKKEGQYGFALDDRIHVPTVTEEGCGRNDHIHEHASSGIQRETSVSMVIHSVIDVIVFHPITNFVRFVLQDNISLLLSAVEHDDIQPSHMKN